MKALDAAWRRTLRRDPQAVALWDAQGRAWTRRELDDAAEAWAAHHPQVEAGRPVFFSRPNGPEWWATFLGALRRGAVPAALDPGEPPAAREALERVHGKHALRRLEPEPRAHAAREDREGDHGKEWGSGLSIELIKLTSGSTGKPKLLPFTGEQMLADGRQVCGTMGIRPKDVNLAVIPFGHSYGLGNLVMPLIAQGTTVVCCDTPLPHAVAAAVAARAVTVMPGVPPLLRALAESDVSAKQLASLRVVISAGAPLAPDIAVRFWEKFGVPIHNFYGSSETGGIAYDRTGEATESGRSAGLPLKGVALHFPGAGIRHPLAPAARAQRAMQPGDDGMRREIGRGRRFVVASAAVGGRGVFRPGDLGWMDPRGELVLLGRAGRMLKVAGRRVDPSEIERAIRAIPGVTDAFVAAHPRRPELLAAVVTPAKLASSALTAGLQGRLAPWKIPRKWVALPRLPTTSRGKIDRARALALLA